MIVVEDQQRLVRPRLGGQFVDQDRHQPLEELRRRRAEQRAHPLADPWPHPVQRGHRITPEPGRVVIARVQRQPRGWPLAAPGPVGQQDRLAVPGGSADQHQAPPQSLIKLFRQTRAGHQARPRAGHMQLGGQQRIPLGCCNLRSGRRGRLSHC